MGQYAPVMQPQQQYVGQPMQQLPPHIQPQQAMHQPMHQQPGQPPLRPQMVVYAAPPPPQQQQQQQQTPQMMAYGMMAQPPRMAHQGMPAMSTAPMPPGLRMQPMPHQQVQGMWVQPVGGGTMPPPQQQQQQPYQG
jgi:hypothetical protein